MTLSKGDIVLVPFPPPVLSPKSDVIIGQQIGILKRSHLQSNSQQVNCVRYYYTEENRQSMGV